MTKQELTKEFFSIIDRKNIVSIYRVGIKDNSLLSDIDLILIVKIKSKIHCSVKNIDIRKIFTEDEFKKNAQYLPYEDMELIYGNEIPILQDTTIETRKLLKLAVMQFTSFLRNFYELDSRPNPKRALVALNDFSYVTNWAKDFNPLGFKKFIEQIHLERNHFPVINEQNINVLIKDAISFSWDFIGHLNEKLKASVPVLCPHIYFYGKHPALIIPSSISDCRRYSEQLGFISSRARILYLPTGFSFVSCKKTIPFVVNYIRINLKPIYSIKRLVQIIILTFMVIHYKLLIYHLK